MADLPWPLIASYVVAAACMLWLLSVNLAAFGRYRTALDGERASLAARAAWTLSLVAVLTGPLVVVAALLAIALGVREQRRAERGEEPRRSRLCAEMAIKNGVVLLASTALVVLFVWLAWRR